MIPLNEIEEELRHHIEARAADLEHLRGLSPRDALREAQLEFGSVTRYVEESREAKGMRWLDVCATSFSAAVRLLRRHRILASAMSVTLALGVAAVTLVASIVLHVLVEPLPFPSAERVYNVRAVIPEFTTVYPDAPVSARLYDVALKKCAACEHLALIDGGTYRIEGQAKLANGLEVTPGFFPVLGAGVQLGRAVRPGDLSPDSGRVAILTDRMWRERFHADLGIIGRKLQLNGAATEIIGVLHPQVALPRAEQLGDLMQFPPTIELLAPLRVDMTSGPEADGLRRAMLVRLRPGVSADEARAEVDRLILSLLTPEEGRATARLVGLRDQLTGQARRPLLLIAAAAGLLLLVVCVNFGSLLFSRVTSRHGELGTRVALGATRADLIRHTLSAAMGVILIGGAAGWMLAWAGLQIVISSAPLFLPLLESLTLKPAAWVAAMLLPILTAVVCAVVPLWQTYTTGVARAREARSARRMRHVLIFFATASTLALVSIGGSIMLHYVRVRFSGHGFSTSRVSTLHIGVPCCNSDAEANQKVHRTLLDRLRALPGVEAVGSSNRLPLIGESWINPLERADRPSSPVPPAGSWRFVSPGYFDAAGTKMLAGRDFAGSDHGERVAVVSKRVADEMFPGEDPIGKFLYQPENGQKHRARIVGMVENAKSKGIENGPPLLVYVPDWHLNSPAAFYVVRASADPDAVAQKVRRIATQLGMDAPAERVAPMVRLIDNATEPSRWQAFWTFSFAIAGLLTACAGLFGVVSYQVSRRTAEIGLRMALGATRRDTARLVLRESMRPVWIGLAAGMAVTLAIGGLAPGHVFVISWQDVWVLLSAAIAVGLSTFAASSWSIRHAFATEPVQALRAE